jgi:hypothetical protein
MSMIEPIMDKLLGANAWLLQCNLNAAEIATLFQTHNLVVAAWLFDDGARGNIRVKCIAGHAPYTPPTISLTIVPVSCEAAALDLEEMYASGASARQELQPQARPPQGQGLRLVWNADNK